MMLDGVEVYVLHPDGPTPATDANATSVVLLVHYGEFEALLDRRRPGRRGGGHPRRSPFGPRGPESWSSRVEHVDVCVASGADFAVISVGARNRYGHPHTDVVRRITESGTRVLRTDLSGDIVIRARRSGLHDVRTEW
jgi:competence protein ComEC